MLVIVSGEISCHEESCNTACTIGENLVSGQCKGHQCWCNTGYREVKLNELLSFLNQPPANNVDENLLQQL